MATEKAIIKSVEVFNLHGQWRISFKGIVPVTTWNCKGAAETQLELLQKGASMIDDRGVIIHMQKI